MFNVVFACPSDILWPHDKIWQFPLTISPTDLESLPVPLIGVASSVLVRSNGPVIGLLLP